MAAQNASSSRRLRGIFIVGGFRAWPLLQQFAKFGIWHLAALQRHVESIVFERLSGVVLALVHEFDRDLLHLHLDQVGDHLLQLLSDLDPALGGAIRWELDERPRLLME